MLDDDVPRNERGYGRGPRDRRDLGSYVLERHPPDVEACTRRSRAHAQHYDRGCCQRRVSVRLRSHGERARGEAVAGELEPGDAEKRSGTGLWGRGHGLRFARVRSMRAAAASRNLLDRVVRRLGGPRFMCSAITTSPLVPTPVTTFRRVVGNLEPRVGAMGRGRRAAPSARPALLLRASNRRRWRRVAGRADLAAAICKQCGTAAAWLANKEMHKRRPVVTVPHTAFLTKRVVYESVAREFQLRHRFQEEQLISCSCGTVLPAASARLDGRFQYASESPSPCRTRRKALCRAERHTLSGSCIHAGMSRCPCSTRQTSTWSGCST